jgi:hypothetical protein
MKQTIRNAAAILTVAWCVAAPTGALADAAERAYEPKDYLVFIDRPTGFAFIRTPQGWKFVRKIESAELLATAERLNPQKALRAKL